MKRYEYINFFLLNFRQISIDTSLPSVIEATILEADVDKL